MLNLCKVMQYEFLLEISAEEINASDGMSYEIHTSATNGSVQTQFFGENFDPFKLETFLKYEVILQLPKNFKGNVKVLIKRVAIDVLPDVGKDRMTVNGGILDNKYDRYEESIKPWYTSVTISLERDVKLAEIDKKLNIARMPGCTI